MSFKVERIETLINNMARLRIAVIGDLMLDRYLWGDVERISPEAPVPVIRLRGESANLGGAANVAANVSALDAKVLLFGLVGDDPEGKLLNELIDQGKFGDNSVITVPDIPTTVKTRIIAGSQHVVRIDRESNTQLDPSVIRKMMVRFRAVLGGIDAVILEDYNKGMLSPDLIGTVINSCREAHVPVGVDPKKDNFWAYKGATVFKPNQRELETALGRTISNDKELRNAGSEVMERLELEYLLITRGREGMTLFTKDRIEDIHTQAKLVHDVSGAGDTVIATLMTSLAAGADIDEAADLANCAAGIVIAEVGAVPVNVRKLKKSCVE
ncbi:D-glycero-beta-D-manno-heptose-7-phosphate kinase [bacterium]|nr:D-glycero-beta-D-manno-heptose-7-phosphate kinase [bacterium]